MSGGLAAHDSAGFNGSTVSTLALLLQVCASWRCGLRMHSRTLSGTT
jgi:hypothetical protein